MWCIDIRKDRKEFLWPLVEFSERRIKPAVSLMAETMLADAIVTPQKEYFGGAAYYAADSDTYGGLWGRFIVEGSHCVFLAAVVGPIFGQRKEWK